MRWRDRYPVLLAAGLTCLAGCTAAVKGDPGGASPGAGSGPDATVGGSNGSGGGGASADCSQPSAPPLHARLLTPSQYDNAVQDLVKVGDHPAKDFGGGVAAKLDEVAVERRANAATAIAAQAVATLDAWSPCAPAAADAAACGAQLVERLGAAAFRHPLAPAERAQLQGLFDAGLAERDFATGVDWLLTGLLQAPDFLYQFAKPNPGEVAGQVVPLDDYELASRLAFFVWDSAPDDALYAAAASGGLSAVEALEGQLQRMMADPKFERGTASFYSDWLGVEGFKEVARDDPSLTSEVIEALKRSLVLGATSLYGAPNPNIQDLFSGQSYYLNAQLRTLYGLSGGGPELIATELPNQERRGLLTHPGLLTLLARPNASDPISRGLFVQRTLLCNEVPLPPPGLEIPELPPIAPGLSTRARLEAHATEPLCASCHDIFDPPGFALEAYDELGRFRTMDQGVPVDTSGVMPGDNDLAGPFGSGGELLQRLATSSVVKSCFAKRYLAFAVSRSLQQNDDCSLARVAEQFTQTGDLKQLVAAVAVSDSFRLRATEDLGAMP